MPETESFEETSFTFAAGLSQRETLARVAILASAFSHEDVGIVSDEDQASITIELPDTLHGRARDRVLAAARDITSRRDLWAERAFGPDATGPYAENDGSHCQVYELTDCTGLKHIRIEPAGSEEWTDDFTETLLGALWNGPLESVMAPGMAVTVRRLA